MCQRLYISLSVLASILIHAGCLGPVRNDYTPTRDISMARESEEADRLWEAAQETLRRNRFQLDRVDRRAGVITTLPVGSQHFFEFWRRDVATNRDFWEATVNPLRRWVEINFLQEDDGPWQKLSIVVHKERLSSLDRQFNSTGAALQYFGDNLPSTTGLVRVTDEYDRWLDLGRDPPLEDRLLEEIFERANDLTLHN